MPAGGVSAIAFGLVRSIPYEVSPDIHGWEGPKWKKDPQEKDG